MAKIHGVAGEWARVKGTVLGLWPLFIGIFATGFALAFWIFAAPLVGAALLAVSLCATGFASYKGARRIERFFKGARGEERVAGILKNLPATYHVFNDFVACGTHVDHVVVGPAGIYSVETKCWAGAVTVEDGHILVNGALPTRSPLAQTVKEAELVRSELSGRGLVYPVTPVLAFASDNFTAHSAEVGGAVIINSRDLAGSFAGGREVITSAEVARIVGIMESQA